MTPAKHKLVRLRGRGGALLAVALVAAACSSNEPTRSAPAPTLGIVIASHPPIGETASTPPSAASTRIEGRWTAEPVRVTDIEESMVAFYGVSRRDADAWAREIGSPTSLAFSLEFSGNTFVQRWQVPGRPTEIGETGTISTTNVEGGSGNFVLLSVADGTGFDTYTLHFVVDGDYLRLHWVASTEHGTAADQAMHRLFTIGFYCSADFTRAP